MASCAYCNTTILFGGKRNGDLRYCNDKCQQQGALASVANQLPREQVAAYLGRVHRGNCPQCDGPGPVEVWGDCLRSVLGRAPSDSERLFGFEGAHRTTVLDMWWGRRNRGPFSRAS